tara:strand:- start:721 stop:978 length:258 start_codon:yes stop_codon:yes gene_type:complete
VNKKYFYITNLEIRNQMNIIGNSIKGVIYVTDKITGDDNPIEEQKEVLKNLVQSEKYTLFVKAYEFESILENEGIQPPSNSTFHI